jgi:hypothetical protein
MIHCIDPALVSPRVRELAGAVLQEDRSAAPELGELLEKAHETFVAWLKQPETWEPWWRTSPHGQLVEDLAHPDPTALHLRFEVQRRERLRALRQKRQERLQAQQKDREWTAKRDVLYQQVIDDLKRCPILPGETSPTFTPKLESRIRSIAGAKRCPVEVVRGCKPPHALGERGYSEFKDGGECKYPGSAIRAGYKVKYVASTFRVEVGRDWLVLVKHDVPSAVLHLSPAILLGNRGIVLRLAQRIWHFGEYCLMSVLAYHLEMAGCTDADLLVKLKGGW